MNHHLSAAAATCLVTALGAGFAPAQGNSTTAPPKSNTAVRLLQMNVWNEATGITDGFNKIVDVIAASNADVVALSEVHNNTGDFHTLLVNALAAKGQTFYGTYIGGDMGLISRFPINGYKLVYPPNHGSVGVWHLGLPDGRTVSVASAHLDYTNYAVYGPRGYDGNSFQMIDKNRDGIPDPVTRISTLMNMDKASYRDEGHAAFTAYAATLPADTPVVLLGDFNECSHLDWTDATKNLYSHNGVVISWANSNTLSTAGFGDTWREIYPNPVTHLGATWPSDAFGKGSTSWAPKADERDRIDFIYYRKNNTLLPSLARVVGSPRHYVFNVLTTDTSQTPYCLTNTPWPSDHKALLADLEVVQSARKVPTVEFATATSSSTAESGTLAVTVRLSAATTLPVSVPFTVSGTATRDSDYTLTASPLQIPAGATTATATITILPDTAVEPNETVVLTMGTPGNAINGLKSTHTATITNGAGSPAVTPSQTTYAPGANIVINFQNAPGNATDWIGLYNPGTVPGSANPSLKWQYINGAINGSATFTGGLTTSGPYVAHLFANDGYTILASCSFDVGTAGAAAPVTTATVTYAAWQEQTFAMTASSAAEADPDADPDDDGLVNLVEYALGTNPHAADHLPAIRHDGDGLAFQLTRPAGGRPDIDYIAECSADQQHWQPALLETAPQGNTETVRIRVPRGVQANFLRLRVEDR